MRRKPPLSLDLDANPGPSALDGIDPRLIASVDALLHANFPQLARMQQVISSSPAAPTMEEEACAIELSAWQKVKDRIGIAFQGHARDPGHGIYQGWVITYRSALNQWTECWAENRIRSIQNPQGGYSITDGIKAIGRAFQDFSLIQNDHMDGEGIYSLHDVLRQNPSLPNSHRAIAGLRGDGGLGTILKQARLELMSVGGLTEADVEPLQIPLPAPPPLPPAASAEPAPMPPSEAPPDIPSQTQQQLTRGEKAKAICQAFKAAAKEVRADPLRAAKNVGAYFWDNKWSMTVGAGTSFLIKGAFAAAAAHITLPLIGAAATAIIVPLVASSVAGAAVGVLGAVWKHRRKYPHTHIKTHALVLFNAQLALDIETRRNVPKLGWDEIKKAAVRGAAFGLLGGVCGEVFQHFTHFSWGHHDVAKPATGATVNVPGHHGPQTIPTTGPVAPKPGALLEPRVTIKPSSVLHNVSKPVVSHHFPVARSGMDARLASEAIHNARVDLRGAIDNGYLDFDSDLRHAAEKALTSNDYVQFQKTMQEVGFRLAQNEETQKLGATFITDGARVGWTNHLVDRFHDKSSAAMESFYRNMIKGRAGGLVPVPY